MKRLSLALVLVLLGGCTVATQSYTPDGRVGYSLNCSGAALTWGNCLTKAGEICKSRGYDVYQKDAQTGQLSMIQGNAYANPNAYQSNVFGFSGTTFSRSMMIACK
jgi:hypothetical protein